MTRIVWTFGLISGGIMAATMAISMMFADQIGFDRGAIIGYATMILAFLVVYVGMRSYRDTVLAGVIGFGRAFKVGISITLIVSVCYVAAWEVIYHTMAPDFAEKYSAYAIEKTRASGASAAQIEAQRQKMTAFQEQYKNPLVNIGMTFLEVFPVGVVVVLVSAAVLSRRKALPNVDVVRV